MWANYWRRGWQPAEHAVEDLKQTLVTQRTKFPVHTQTGPFYSWKKKIPNSPLTNIALAFLNGRSQDTGL